MVGGTDKYLGYGYKLLKGNYIPSDFDNFTHSILDIESVKEYDESYIDENILTGMISHRLLIMILIIIRIFHQ